VKIVRGRKLKGGKNMASESNWICDWCGKREDRVNVPPFFHVRPDIVLAQKGRHEEILLFPDDMRHKEGPDGKITHSEFQGDLCEECVKEVVSAVARARETRIAKRPKK
jgi:hypothetical protein